ncbi:hypothetical protein F5I97DRAFT_1927440 [Phlebopus sp. FC_14]|nr:hypothetical protein F5I97DRAFT_1927440 [Phlebopus sp. FC_14]
MHTDGGRDVPAIVEWPKGQADEDDFNLMEVMGLEHDRGAYLEILRDVRALCHAAQLDCMLNYCHQPAKDLGNLFDMIKHKHPLLACFRNNWATLKIVKQFLCNQRKYGALKRKEHTIAVALSTSASGSDPPVVSTPNNGCRHHCQNIPMAAISQSNHLSQPSAMNMPSPNINGVDGI